MRYGILAISPMPGTYRFQSMAVLSSFTLETRREDVPIVTVLDIQPAMFCHCIGSVFCAPRRGKQSPLSKLIDIVVDSLPPRYFLFSVVYFKSFLWACLYHLYSLRANPGAFLSLHLTWLSAWLLQEHWELQELGKRLSLKQKVKDHEHSQSVPNYVATSLKQY